MSRIDWRPVIERTAAWVEAQDGLVTLRQAFYMLVSEQSIPNTQAAYSRLSALTAQARRDGWFPPLEDGTREVTIPQTWTSPELFARDAVNSYRIDRWAGQEWLVIVGMEKRGLLAQVRRLVGRYGFPLVALGGFCSQTVTDDVRRLIVRDGRPAVLLYVGDHDASGHVIERDFVQRVGLFDTVERVALTAEQVAEFGLPENPAKDTDSRTAAFAEWAGRVQVEVDALPVDVLAGLLIDAVDGFVDVSTFEAAMGVEAAGRQALADRLAS